MRKLLATLVLSILALTGRADAAIIGEDRIELRPPTITIERLEPVESSATRLSVPPLPTARVTNNVFGTVAADDLRGPIRFGLPEIGPDGLDLQVRCGRFLFCVGAEIVTGRAPITWTPRLDCDTRETYFWLRLSYDVTESVAVYVESFQSAGAILGGPDPLHATQGYVWDGYQAQLGLRLQVTERVAVEGGPVLYALSATHQPGGLGWRVGLRFDF